MQRSPVQTLDTKAQGPPRWPMFHARCHATLLGGVSSVHTSTAGQRGTTGSAVWGRILDCVPLADFSLYPSL